MIGRSMAFRSELNCALNCLRDQATSLFSLLPFFPRSSSDNWCDKMKMHQFGVRERILERLNSDACACERAEQHVTWVSIGILQSFCPCFVSGTYERFDVVRIIVSVLASPREKNFDGKDADHLKFLRVQKPKKEFKHPVRTPRESPACQSLV